jgi:hypothetical protein
MVVVVEVVLQLQTTQEAVHQIKAMQEVTVALKDPVEEVELEL